MITLTTTIDEELDAIDWDAPTTSNFEKQYYERQQTTAEDRNPDLYAFVSLAAEVIQDDDDWKVFTEAFHQAERKRVAAA